MKKSLKMAEFMKLSSGTLLFAFALAVVIGNTTRDQLIPPHDSLLGVSLRTLFWMVAGLALLSTTLCFIQKRFLLPMLLVVWFAVNFEIYQAAFFYLGGTSLNGYWAGVAYAFGISPGTVNGMIEIAALYLLTGNIASLVWLKIDAQKPRVELYTAAKMICPECGGHIQFVSQNMGREVSCPHCQKTIFLRTSENIKMSCFHCQGHVEFPSHALGQKVPCPHCQMSIVLTE